MKDKAQDKREKQIIQQQKSNVIRDRKARPFYVDPSTEKYYRLTKGEEKSFYLFDTRVLISILPIMIGELFFREDIYWALIATILINIGFEVYYRYLIKGLHESNNPPQEVVDTFNSELVLRAKRSDMVLKVALGVIIAYMVMTNPNAFDYLGKTTMVKFVANIVPYLAMAMSLTPISELMAVNKRLKVYKKKKK